MRAFVMEGFETPPGLRDDLPELVFYRWLRVALVIWAAISIPLGIVSIVTANGRYGLGRHACDHRFRSSVAGLGRVEHVAAEADERMVLAYSQAQNLAVHKIEEDRIMARHCRRPGTPLALRPRSRL
jgi:hypothetical protein